MSTFLLTILLTGKSFVALLQTFGLWVGLRGFANVLHYGLCFFFFERGGRKNKINSINFVLTFQRAVLKS